MKNSSPSQAKQNFFSEKNLIRFLFVHLFFQIKTLVAIAQNARFNKLIHSNTSERTTTVKRFEAYSEFRLAQNKEDFNLANNYTEKHSRAAA